MFILFSMVPFYVIRLFSTLEGLYSVIVTLPGYLYVYLFLLFSSSFVVSRQQ